MRRFSLILTTILLMTGCVTAGEKKTACRFSLRPAMTSLSSPGVPMLDEHTVDADLSAEARICIEPERLYGWVFQPDESVIFNLKTQGMTVLTVWDWENRPVSQRQFDSGFTNKVMFEVTISAWMHLRPGK
jgi:hypothetical protein